AGQSVVARVSYSKNVPVLFFCGAGRWQLSVLPDPSRAQSRRGEVHSGQKMTEGVSEMNRADHSPRGFMVVCDGSNGAGKTTLIQNLRQYLEERRLETVVTREPGGTPIVYKFRVVLLSPNTPMMFLLTVLFIFVAALAYSVREIILLALAAGKVVLGVRFDSATVSVQKYARGLYLDLVDSINALAL